MREKDRNLYGARLSDAQADRKTGCATFLAFGKAGINFLKKLKNRVIFNEKTGIFARFFVVGKKGLARSKATEQRGEIPSVT